MSDTTCTYKIAFKYSLQLNYNYFMHENLVANLQFETLLVQIASMILDEENFPKNSLLTWLLDRNRVLVDVGRFSP